MCPIRGRFQHAIMSRLLQRLISSCLGNLNDAFQRLHSPQTLPDSHHILASPRSTKQASSNPTIIPLQPLPTPHHPSLPPINSPALSPNSRRRTAIPVLSLRRGRRRRRHVRHSDRRLGLLAGMHPVAHLPEAPSDEPPERPAGEPADEQAGTGEGDHAVVWVGYAVDEAPIDHEGARGGLAAAVEAGCVAV